MKITNRDWVILSSYLDGELTPAELNKFEERLVNDPALQYALDELRQTKNTLAQTPRLRAPRNFILTPAMVGMKIRPRQAQGYRLASALMTFLLIGVLVLDFGRGFVSGSMASAPKEILLEAVSDAEDDALEGPALLEAEAELESDRAVAEAEAPLEEAAPAAEAAAEGMEEEQSLGFAEEPETKTGPEATGDSAANQAEDWQEGEGAEEEPAPSQALGTEVPETPIPLPSITEYYPAEETHRLARGQALDIFRILEISLGLGALGFGITAWVIRRQKTR
jgi:hypothetical protein